MENYLFIGLGILFFILIIRFLLKTIKGITYMVLLFLATTVALHFFKPEVIDKFIGAERHQKITEYVTGWVDDIFQNTNEFAEKTIDKVIDN